MGYVSRNLPALVGGVFLGSACFPAVERGADGVAGDDADSAAATDASSLADADVAVPLDEVIEGDSVAPRDGTDPVDAAGATDTLSHGPCERGAVCDDGNPCTLDDRCDAAGACAGSARTCDDGEICTVDTCDAVRGCEHTPLIGSQCDDGDGCTVKDACGADGRCVGEVRDCDDQNLCTLDSCSATGECEHVPDHVAKACDDGDACTAADACDASGTCVGALVSCDDDNPCTADACDPSDGACTHTPLFGQACDDADLCTTGDTCTVAGTCAGTLTPGDDGDPCTIDTCWPGTGQCVSRPLGVTVTKTAGGTEVKGEYGHGHVMDGPGTAGFLVTGRQTAFLGVPGDVSATFASDALLQPVFGIGLYLATTAGEDRRLNDVAATGGGVVVGAGAVRQSGVWTGLILVRVTGGDIEVHLSDGTTEFRAVSATPSGFAVVGQRSPSSGIPGAGALVLLSPFGEASPVVAYGAPTERPLHVAGRLPTAVIVGARGSDLVINAIDFAAGTAGGLVPHGALLWDSFDAAASDGAHVLVAGHAGEELRIAVLDATFDVVNAFTVPQQAQLTGIALRANRLALTGPRSWEGWVGVYSLAGELAWEHVLDGGEPYFGPKDVLLDPDGNVTVVGLAGPGLPATASAVRYFMQAHISASGMLSCAQ